MSDLDDFDSLETNFGCDHGDASARKARAGRKTALQRIARVPLWKRQLGTEKQRKPITLAGQEKDR